MRHLMADRRIQRLCWWVLVGSTVLCLALTTAFGWGHPDTLLYLGWLCYAPVGAVVAKHRPENPIGWTFMLTGFMASLALFAERGVHAALAAGPPAAWWGVLSAWIFTWALGPLFMLPTTFTFLLYPSGLPSPRWRPVFRLAVAFTVAITLLAALSPTLWVGEAWSNTGAFTVDNPIGLPLPITFFNVVVGGIGNLVGLALVVMAFCSALLRFWRSQGVERLQMRLFASAILLLPVLGLAANVLAPSNALVRYGIVAVGFASIPLACGVAVMRYRLYDIDRIIGRTTAYGLVTGVLVAVYAVVVTAVTALLPGSGDAAVAGATLAAAAAFRPVLGWARRLVDRRFNREGYDAERTLEQFAVRMRAEVDGDEVVEDLLAVLDRTVQPRAAGVWLRERS